MKVALIGFTGRVGSRVFAELLRRGHHVVGIARDPSNAVAQPRVQVKIADATDANQLAQAIAGSDAAISATRFVSSDAQALVAAMTQAHVKRLLVVRGAASLEVAPGRALLDAPGFPDAYRPEAVAGRRFLDVLRGESDLDWVFLSPSAEFVPGIRTGKFRVGGDQLLTAADGHSWISMEDFAIAMVDELENPHHHRQRFTVGY